MWSIFISDHFHPWLDEQGESPFVWSVIGAISATTSLLVMTGVTCPTMRIHPANLAQAAATSQLLLEGRFVFGVGSGEALNEHNSGDRWPPVDTRLEMLEEAITIIRELWEGGFVTVMGATTRWNLGSIPGPNHLQPVLVSGFGPKAVDLAARIGDGFVTVQPDRDLLDRYRAKGGGGKAIAALKGCRDPDEQRARKLAHQLWRTEGVEGQLAQELPALTLRRGGHQRDRGHGGGVRGAGPDPERHLHAISKYLDAGFDELYINQIGPDQRVLPVLRCDWTEVGGLAGSTYRDIS